MNKLMYEHFTQSEIVERGQLHLEKSEELVKRIALSTGLDFQLLNVEEITRYRFSKNVGITQYNEHTYKFKTYKWVGKKIYNFILEIDDAETKIVIGYRKPTMKTMKYHVIDWDSISFSNMCYQAADFINNLK